MDENTVRLWLKDHQDAVEKLAQQQPAAFQTQFETLRTGLQVTRGLLQNRQRGGGDQVALLPRSMRLDVPKFSRVDPERWIFAINKYFSLLNTLADQHLRIMDFKCGCGMVLVDDKEWFDHYLVQWELLVSKPTTLGDVFSLARITEARFEAIVHKEKETAKKAQTIKETTYTITSL
nr:prolyl oligopeptidase family protein [Tanacetum cinerariifolium]